MYNYYQILYIEVLVRYFTGICSQKKIFYRIQTAALGCGSMTTTATSAEKSSIQLQRLKARHLDTMFCGCSYRLFNNKLVVKIKIGSCKNMHLQIDKKIRFFVEICIFQIHGLLQIINIECNFHSFLIQATFLNTQRHLSNT